jgi:hypothetical protein
MVSVVIRLVAVAVPVVLALTALYWIIRLGVKHGLRSYEMEKARDSEAAV